MMRKCINCILILIMVVSVCTPISFAEELTVDVYVNGRYLETDQPAIIINGRTMVPFRAITAALACDVLWEEQTSSVEIKNEVTIVRVQINNYVMTKTDRETQTETRNIELDVPPIIYNNRTLVPARAIAEALYADVSWDGANRRVDINLEYDYIDKFDTNGHAEVRKNGKYGLINESREIVVPVKYDYVGFFSEERCPVKNDSFYGFVDKEGAEIIPLIYDDVRWFSQGLAAVKKGGKWGYVDYMGNVRIPFEYDSAGDFFNQKAYVSKDGEKFYIDNTGKKIEDDKLASEFDDIYVEYEGFTAVKKDGKWGFINGEGEIVVPLIYEDKGFGFFSPDEGLCNVKKDGKWGFIDNTGKEVIPFIYEDAAGFGDGFASVKKDGKYGMINAKGETMVPFEYDFIGSFVNGYASAAKNGKYGFLDMQGNVAIPFEYDDVDYFRLRDGLARVKKDGRAMYIDKEGNFVKYEE